MNTANSIRLIGLLLATSFAATAAPIKFRVNMEYQISSGGFTVGSDTVEAKGSFNGWGAGVALSPSASDAGIYEGTYDVTDPVGTTIQFKFHIYGSRDTWEGIQGYIYTNGGNRAFVYSGVADSTMLVHFADQWGGTLPMTVSVDMGPQTLAGNFTPGTDTVELKGSFNGWGGGMALTNDSGSATPNIYSGTFDATGPAPNSLIAYKFHFYGGHDKWESDPNRLMMMLSNGVTAPLTCFDRACAVPVKVAAYLQVNMNAQVPMGTFDYGTNEVWARGDSFGGWGNPPQGLQLFQDSARPGIYTNTWTALQVPGAPIQFKFTIWNPTAGSTKWEDNIGGNRTVVWSGTEPVDAAGNHVQNYGPVYFDNVSPSDILMTDTYVTFRVDMANAMTMGGTPFDPVNDTLWVNGEFFPNGWWTWGGSGPAGSALTNDPGTSIYYSMEPYLVPKGHSVALTYKYGINGADNEAASGNNHIRYIRLLGNYTMPLDKFGSMVREEVVGSATAARSGNQIVVSWNGRPGVHLQSRASLTSGSWTDVAGTEGASSASFPVSGAPSYFRLIKP